MQTHRGNVPRKSVFAVFLILLCAVPCLAMAEAAHNTQLTPAGTPAAGQCTLPGILDAPGELPLAVAVLPPARDGACVIAIADAQRARKQANATLIDVRLSAHFQSYHIPGSLNIPLHAIKTKAFLKHRPLVLVNEGRTSLALEQTCQELRQQGFVQVAVLDGGLKAWHDAQGELVGDLFAQRPLHYVTPAELFSERTHAAWLVLDFSAAKRQSVYQWLPQNIEPVVPAQAASSKAHIAALRSTVERYRTRLPNLKILGVSDHEIDYGPITTSVRQAGLEKVFYLGFGLHGYEDFLTRQMAMWHQKSQPVTFPACQG